MNKKFCLYRFLPILLLCLFFGGCAESDGKGEPITGIRQLDGQAIGVMTGSTFDQYTDEFIQDADKKYYNEYADMAVAVKQGKIAAFLMDEPMARMLCSESDGIAYLPEYLTNDSYAFVFPKTDKGLGCTLSSTRWRGTMSCFFPSAFAPHSINTMGFSRRESAAITASVKVCHPRSLCDCGECARTVRTVLSRSTPCFAQPVSVLPLGSAPVSSFISRKIFIREGGRSTPRPR